MDNQFGSEGENVYQEVTNVNWFQRLTNSIFAVILGFLLFFSSFLVLFFNEGSIDFSKAAKDAVVITTTTPPTQAAGKTVALTGNIETNDRLGDSQFLKPDAYVVLARTTEMFSWQETQESQSKTNLGGSQTTLTTYKYTKEWTNSPADSRSFSQSGHINPPKAVANGVFKVANAKIGNYQPAMEALKDVVNSPNSCTSDDRTFGKINDGGISLPAGNRVSLTAANLLPTQAKPVADYLFQGKGTPESPQIGDLRICYNALPNNSTVTIFGKLDGNRIIPTQFQNQPFFRLAAGTRQQAIADLKSEHSLFLWIFRILGFFMMWFGLIFCYEPLSVFLSVIPFFGGLADMVGCIGSLIVAAILSFVTIVVSSLIHNPLILLATIAITVIALSIGKTALRSSPK